MKRKEGESSFEFRQRVKKAKYKRAHQYDQEKQYWRNVRENQRRGIENLFARAGAASSSGAAAYNAAQLAPLVSRLPAVAEGLLFNPYAPVAAEVAGELLPALGTTLGAGLGGAVAVAGALGYAAGSLVDNLLATDSTQNILNLMPGTYQGRFALSAAKVAKGLRDRYQKNGCVWIEEIYGSCVDPDLCYVGHSTFNVNCVVSAIGCALLRKLFRKGVQIDLTTPYEEIPLVEVSTPNSGPGYKIVYHITDTDGTTLFKTIGIPNDQSLNTLLNAADPGGWTLYNQLIEQMTSQNPNVIQKVYLIEDNLSGQQRTQCMLNMNKEKLSVAMSSHIVVQNRTKTASEGSNAGSITQVDVQPLKGPVYEFSLGVPKAKNQIPFLMGAMHYSGVMLYGSSQLPGTDAISYKEPPVKNVFQNVVKSGYTRLNPGALKSMTIGSDISGYFGNVLQRLRYDIDGTVIARCYGKSQLVCFEEELNSGSSNNMVIQYEKQHVVGAEFVTTRAGNLQPGYATTTINNV